MLRSYICRLFIACVVLSLLSGCAVTNKFGPYIGKVVDAETKAPIEGAVVFMECFSQTGSFAGSVTSDAGFKEVLTDENGEFRLELRVVTFRPGHLWDYNSYVSVFKPGYGVYLGHPGAKADILIKDSSYLPTNTYVTISLPELKTRKERSRNLHNINMPSGSEISFEEMKNIFHLRNVERVYLGFKSIPAPR